MKDWVHILCVRTMRPAVNVYGNGDSILPTGLRWIYYGRGKWESFGGIMRNYVSSRLLCYSEGDFTAAKGIGRGKGQSNTIRKLLFEVKKGVFR